VRQDPPEVFVAEDVDVLNRVLALELVGRTPSHDLEPDQCAELRGALLEERWADAVIQWMRLRGVAVDVYTHLHVYTEQDAPPELVGAQLQFSPIFRDL
jgi:hypothetical protein